MFRSQTGMRSLGAESTPNVENLKDPFFGYFSKRVLEATRRPKDSNQPAIERAS